MKASKHISERIFHLFSILLFPEMFVCPLGNLTGKKTSGSLKAKINGKGQKYYRNQFLTVVTLVQI